MKEKEEMVWSYVLGYDSDYGHVPSLAQIQEHFKWKNKMSAKYYVDMLIKSGHLRKVTNPHYVYYQLINKK